MSRAAITLAIGGASEIPIRGAVASFGIVDGRVACDRTDSPPFFQHASLWDRDGRLVLIGHLLGQLPTYDAIRIERPVIAAVGGTIVLAQHDEAPISIRSHRPIIPASFETDEAPFLADLLADPDDDAVREVYSDALIERGHHRRATWLRAELAARRDDTQRARLHALSRELAGAPHWLAIVSRARIAWRVGTPAYYPARLEPCPFVDECPRWWNAVEPSPEERDPPWLGQTRACQACGETITLHASRRQLERGSGTVVAIDPIAMPDD